MKNYCEEVLDKKTNKKTLEFVKQGGVNFMIRDSEISVEKTYSGAIVISMIVNGVLETRRYFYISVAEAKRRFKKEMEDLLNK